MPPPKNLASPHDLATCLKGSLSFLDSDVYLKSDLASVVDSYVEAMIQVVKITPKPTVASLAAAASTAFDGVDPQEARAFAERFFAGIAYCRGKGKSCTTGKKLPASVYRVATALAAWSKPQGCPDSPVDLTKPGLHRGTTASLDRAAVLRMYGAVEQRAPQQAVQVDQEVERQDLVHILSSQEEEVWRGSGSASSSSWPAAGATKPWVQYWDTVANAFVRASGGQVVATAKMSAGPLGFAEGVFPGETQVFVSELPNLMLDTSKQSTAKKKRPASKQIFRRPARKTPVVAEPEEVGEEEEEGDEQKPAETATAAPAPAPAPAHHQGYKKMHYSSTGAWAVRQTFFSRKQVFQVMSKHKTSKQLEDIVDQALLRLNGGQSEECVKTWAKAQLLPS